MTLCGPVQSIKRSVKRSIYAVTIALQKCGVVVENDTALYGGARTCGLVDYDLIECGNPKACSLAQCVVPHRQHRVSSIYAVDITPKLSVSLTCLMN